MRRTLVWTGALASAVMMVQTGTAWAEAACCGGGAAEQKPACEAPAAAAAPEAKPQTKCPVMGGAVNKDLYVDAAGVRIYVCCNACIAKVKAEPEKYIAAIKANGETAEALPVKPAQAPAPAAEAQPKAEAK